MKKKIIIFWLLAAVVLALAACEIKIHKGVEKHYLTKPAVYPYDIFRRARMKEKSPQLLVGSAVVDLTPKNSTSTWVAGYAPNKRSTGIHSPITGRIIYIDDGEHALTYVSFDFVGLMNQDIALMQELVSKDFKDEIIMSSAHNHAGPDVMGIWGRAIFYMLPVENGRDPGYMLRVYQSVQKGILDAQSKAVPATLSAASIKGPQGFCDNWRLPGYWDDTATGLMASDLNGRPIATWVNWACHVEFLGDANAMISSDYPGFFYKRIEQRGGGAGLFSNGAIGGIVVPIIGFEKESMPVHLRVKAAESLGYELADLMMDALAKNGETISNPKIWHKKAVFDLPVDNWKFQRFVLQGTMERPTYNHSGSASPYLRTEAHALTIGDLAISTVPGEIFPVIGFGIKEKLMNAKHKMVIGLANDELGYIMLPSQFEMDVYDYEQSVSLGANTSPILWKALAELWGKPNEELPKATDK